MTPTRLNLVKLADTGFYFCPRCEAVADKDTDAIAARTCTRCGRSPLRWLPGFGPTVPPVAPPRTLPDPPVPEGSFLKLKRLQAKAALRMNPAPQGTVQLELNDAEYAFLGLKP